MKDMDKIRLLKEILADKDLVSKKILKEEVEPKGILEVSAEGDSPEDAKQKILDQLQKVDLPDEEEMGEEMEDEFDEEMEEEEFDDEMEEEFDEDMLDEEDQDVLEMLPEKSRAEFKKRLIEKIKNL